MSERREIAKVYFRIDNLNYEAKKTSGVDVIYDVNPTDFEAVLGRFENQAHDGGERNVESHRGALSLKVLEVAADLRRTPQQYR